MNRKNEALLGRLRDCIDIPRMHTGGGGPTSSTMGHILYARDAATALGAAREAMLSMMVGDDWEGWVDAPADEIVAALERWRARRVADDWGARTVYVLSVRDLLDEVPT